MEKQVKFCTVFPDYMSTGLWDSDGISMIMPDSIPESLRIALRYWHEMWEFLIAENKMSVSYRKRWWEDGQRIVDNLNLVQDEYHFIYDVTLGED